MALRLTRRRSSAAGELPLRTLVALGTSVAGSEFVPSGVEETADASLSPVGGSCNQGCKGERLTMGFVEHDSKQG